MFRIGIFELALTCGLVALVIIIPVIVTRGYVILSKRLNNIEKKIDNKQK